MKPDRLLFFAPKQYSGPSQMDRSKLLNFSGSRIRQIVANATPAARKSPEPIDYGRAAKMQLRKAAA
jgi:hypothetical protein